MDEIVRAATARPLAWDPARRLLARARRRLAEDDEREEDERDGDAEDDETDADATPRGRGEARDPPDDNETPPATPPPPRLRADAAVALAAALLEAAAARSATTTTPRESESPAADANEDADEHPPAALLATLRDGAALVSRPAAILPPTLDAAAALPSSSSAAASSTTMRSESSRVASKKSERLRTRRLVASRLVPAAFAAADALPRAEAKAATEAFARETLEMIRPEADDDSLLERRERDVSGRDDVSSEDVSASDVSGFGWLLLSLHAGRALGAPGSAYAAARGIEPLLGVDLVPALAAGLASERREVRAAASAALRRAVGDPGDAAWGHLSALAEGLEDFAAHLADASRASSLDALHPPRGGRDDQDRGGEDQDRRGGNDDDDASSDGGAIGSSNARGAVGSSNAPRATPGVPYRYVEAFWARAAA